MGPFSSLPPAPLLFFPLPPSLISLTSETEDLVSVAFDLEVSHAEMLLCSQSALLSASMTVTKHRLILVLTTLISISHPFASPLQISASSFKFVLQFTCLFALLCCLLRLYFISCVQTGWVWGCGDTITPSAIHLLFNLSFIG